MRKTAILRTFWEGNQEKIWLRDDLFGRGLNSNFFVPKIRQVRSLGLDYIYYDIGGLVQGKFKFKEYVTK